jgi:hypothetical protein
VLDCAGFGAGSIAPGKPDAAWPPARVFAPPLRDRQGFGPAATTSRPPKTLAAPPLAPLSFGPAPERYFAPPVSSIHSYPSLCGPRSETVFGQGIDGYAGPVHVWSDGLRARCVRLGDGCFHVFQRGDFTDLLDGPDYILAVPRLAAALRTLCPSTVEIVPAQVVNIQSGQSLASYEEVRAREEITPGMIETVDAQGDRAWHFKRRHLFVTKHVALLLRRRGFPSRGYSRGFSEFIARSPAG